VGGRIDTPSAKPASAGAEITNHRGIHTYPVSNTGHAGHFNLERLITDNIGFSVLKRALR